MHQSQKLEILIRKCLELLEDHFSKKDSPFTAIRRGDQALEAILIVNPKEIIEISTEAI